MGCCTSVPHSPRVAPTKKTTNNMVNNKINQTDSFTQNQFIRHCEEMFIYPKQIMSGVSHVPRPDETDFIACLTEFSFPLVLSPTSIDDKDMSCLVMPIVGISLHEKGRVAAFGSIDILTECKQENAEFLAFFENLLCFICGPRPVSSIIYLLDIEAGDSTLLIHNISGLGYHIETGKSAENLSRYACVITIGGTLHGSQLYEYIINGGGVIVCCSFNSQNFINLLPFPFISPSALSLSQHLTAPSSTVLSKQQSSTNLVSSTSVPLANGSMMASSAANLNISSNIFDKQDQALELKQQQRQQQILTEYVNKSNHRANSWLSRCGLGISDAHIVFPVIPKAVIKIKTKSFDLEQATFPFVVDCYKKILHSDNINNIDFSNIINILRYNILTINRTQSDLLAVVLDESLSYLQETNYEQPEGLFYSDIHNMLAVLLCDIINSINPHEFTTRFFNTNLFPGDFEPSQDTLQEISINVSLRSSEWHSTGLWLPARTIATVTIIYAANNKTTITKDDYQPSSPLSPNSPSEFSNDIISNQKSFPLIDENNEIENPSMSFDDLFIQIGSQSESLLSSPGPWKRWPNVVICYPITEDTFEISSPFGGLIYINDAYSYQSNINYSQDFCNINENENLIIDGKSNRPRKMTIKFSNVVQCPFYSKSDRWNETKDSQTPWAEISTKYSIITLPSESIRKITNLESNVKIIDNIIKEILSFSCYSYNRKFRLVFDVDSPKIGSTSSYPLMLSYDTLDSFINIDNPSSDVFAMILKISIVTIPGNALDPNVEAAFGTLIAAHTLLRIYSTKVKSPYEFIYGHMTPIFNELWNIYTRHDKKLFQTVLGKFQHLCKHDSFLTNEESVQFIVNELESITEKNFSSFLNEALHPGENGDQQFPEYVVSEEEEEKNE